MYIGLPDKVLDYLCVGSQFTNAGNSNNQFVGMNAVATLINASV